MVSVKGKQLVNKLRSLGVRIETGRGRGGHLLASLHGRQTVIKMHGAKDLSNRYVELICSQLDIDPGEL